MKGIEQKLNSFFSRIHLDAVKIPRLDIHAGLFTLLIFIAIILVLSFLINYLLSRSILGSKYRIFVAPGVILHEWSHAFFCLLTGAKIKKISLFDKDGGKVEHYPSKIPVLGQILISFAPFAIGAVVIYFLAKLLGFHQAPLDFTLNSKLPSLWNSLKLEIGSFDFAKWQNWAIVYLVLSIAVTMMPSRKDFENVAFSLLFLLIVFLAVYQFFSMNLSAIIVPVELIAVLSTTIFLLILSFVLSIVIYVFSLMIKHT
jgi:hypothetical protein